MHQASTSIKYFGVYVVVTGLGLLFAPGLVLSPLGLAVPAEIWVRVLGAVAAILGYYYWTCGVANAVDFFRATVKGRIGFAILIGVLIALFNAPLQLLLFAAIDLAGAAWTAYRLRQSVATSH